MRSRRQTWEQRAETPLLVAAVVFLVGYAAPIAWPDLPPDVVQACAVLMAGAWALFGVDYVVRVALADDRRAFVRSHVLDLLVLVVPMLRPLRLLRLVTVLSVVRRVGASTWRVRVVAYASGGTLLLVLLGALAVTDAERGAPGASITNLGDGLWWAVATITSVGYGDLVPVTATGRVVAATLMTGGLALLGSVTATLASWLVERVAEENELEQAATRAQVAALHEEVRRLREELAGTGAGAAEGPSRD